MKLLLYCTKAKPYIKSHSEYEYNEKGAIPETRKRVFTLCQDKCDYYNGKIVAECYFEVEEIRLKFDDYEVWIDSNIDENVILKQSCLGDAELYNYLGGGNGDRGYAIHIKNLHIFDKSRELYDCLINPKIEPKYYGCEHLSKAPQNMMYVELDDIKYILISIRPEWLCKILNGEKTIEVRKKVLKEMLANEQDN